jgi:hypothetical protein
MDPSQFTEHAPGRLVPLPEGLMAFVPDALPSSLPMDDETHEWFVLAIHSVGRLGGLSEALPGARLYVGHYGDRGSVRRLAQRKERHCVTGKVHTQRVVYRSLYFAHPFIT